MYFKDRVDAGKQLGQLLLPKYRYENCAVVALSDGGVVVGAQIAAQLHCVLMMLMTEAIYLPGEPEAIAAIDQDGNFVYSGNPSSGTVDYYQAEFRGHIEQQKIAKMHHMNQLVGSGGIIDKHLLRGHHVILVSDGLQSGTLLDSAAEYIKSIPVETLIIATPIASVPAVDRMHLLGDDLYCLGVLDNYMETNHYYEENTIPDHEVIVKTIKDIVLHWQ